MGLETGDYISDLNQANPLGTDAKSQGDDHLRLVKKVLKQSFPNINGAVTGTPAALNNAASVSPTFTTLELGHASDTTLARIAAGRVSIEGGEIAKLNANNLWTGEHAWEGGSPLHYFVETDAAANNKRWRLMVAGEALTWELVNDAVSAAVAFMSVQRTANVCDSISFNGTAINLTGTAITLTGTTYCISALEVQGTLAQLRFNETDAALNEKIWEFRASGGDFFLYTDTDGGSATGTPLSITRNGTSVAAITITADDISLNAAVGVHIGATDTTLARIAAGRLSLEGIELGYRQIPIVSTAGTTAAVADVGKFYSTTGGITVPNSTFSGGDSFSIYNHTAGNITITQAAGLTLRLAGTATTGNRTLAQRGIATVLFISATEAVISGAGLS